MSLRKSVSIIVALFYFSIAHANAETLFDDLGGRPGLERLADTSLKLWLADPRVGPTFEDTDLDRFKRLLVEQLCTITGGGCTYSGHTMKEAHRGLHLATNQFNALAEDMQTAMEQMNIRYSAQNRLLALLAPMQRDVVTR